MDTCLEIKNLTKRYQDFTLDNISFSLPMGSIMGFIGENGAGKTTTLNLILNLIKKDSGDIRVFGKDHIKEERSIKEQIGVVLDEGFFYENLRSKEVAFSLKHVYRTWDQRLFDSYLEKFRLPKEKPLKEFSKGMKMKLSIASALAHHPRFLILDEATSGLDPIVRNEILDIFLEFIQEEDHAILISSHITSDLEKVADYITFIHEGKIVLSDSKDRLLETHGLMKCGATDFEKIDASDIIGYLKSDFGYTVLIKDKNQAKQKYRNYIIDKANLEDIMLLYCKGEHKC